MKSDKDPLKHPSSHVEERRETMKQVLTESSISNPDRDKKDTGATNKGNFAVDLKMQLQLDDFKIIKLTWPQEIHHIKNPDSNFGSHRSGTR